MKNTKYIAIKMNKNDTRYCDRGCGYKLPTEYAINETTCGACLNEIENEETNNENQNNHPA